MDKNEIRDRMAEEHRDEIFKNNPSGFTCAPYVNEDSPCESFEQGWDAALKHDPKVLKLIKTIKFYGSYKNWKLFNLINGGASNNVNDDSGKRARAALKEFRL